MENIRIDKGVERKAVARSPFAQDQEEGQHPSIPADLDVQHVLDLYLTYRTTSQIAKDLGITRKSLVRWIVDKAPEQWKKVQVVRALCKKEDGDEGIESCVDALSLARAREMLKSGQWDLERLDSRTYGPKQEITANVQPILNIMVMAAPQQLAISPSNNVIEHAHAVDKVE